MSKENPTPREHAENIILNAMKMAERQYSEAIKEEEGKLTRLDLINSYAGLLASMSIALQAVSTEHPE